MNLSHTGKRQQKGSALIEVALSYSVLVMVALVTLKASINTASSQAWTVKQAMTDAYLTRETALATRVPFDEINTSSSLWALSPGVTTSTVVIGRLPGGRVVTADLHRTRIAAPNNLPSAGGTGTTATNPGETEGWKLQSILAYQIGDKEYVKTRTTLRTR
jgi:hypothetical protein